MQGNSNTQYFKIQNDANLIVKDTIDSVYVALTEKGYNPVSQIVGYIMSGDPTYITNHNGARSQIMRVERDEIIEELLREYIRTHFDVQNN
ncbi:MAG: IreB family regulatory phosphoprotein [Lachnospiraceae bacterium]|nr:IreB family regulatory phosphoprotein [Lachnospiraceae bacterium]MBO4559096.1 IreB family regulatory phosphoprotein [Lachnospiraceae bacterium]MBR5733896.1 IreB family regulatory phosphoprotein [Lachnospiraceae bacterium]